MALNYLGLVLSVAVISSVISFVASPVAAKLALLLNIVDYPAARKVHKKTTPLLGGLAVYIGLMAGFVFAQKNSLIDFINFTPALGTLIGVTLIFLLGLLDDILGVSARWKLFGQFLAALVLIFYEVKLSIFIQNNLIATVITLVWIVGITNSFNLLDNMNGLSSGVGLIAALAFSWVAYEQGDYFILPITAALAGAIIGFLPHNFPSAKLFLGDAGSLLIGYSLAIISVQGIYLASSKLTHLPLITPILLLGVPLFDTFSVMLIRIKNGVSIFTADKNHFSHRLVDLGMTHKQAVLLIWIIAVQISLPAILLNRVTIEESFVLLIQELLLFGIIVLLMRSGMVSRTAKDKGIPVEDSEEDIVR